MSDENQVKEETGGDSFVDAISAISLVSIAVIIAIYWIANQG
jgi:hypothetical protein